MKDSFLVRNHFDTSGKSHSLWTS